MSGIRRRDASCLPPGPPAGRGARRRRPALVSCLLAAIGATAAFAADADLLDRRHRIAPDAPGWRELARQFAEAGAVAAPFEERRSFPFRSEPVVLAGTARIAPPHGVSLEYLAPEPRIVIMDKEGMLLRDARGETVPPPDPRAAAANAALRHILRFDLEPLTATYHLHGRRDGATWSLALVPRDPAVRRAVGDILVDGEGAAVRRIELRRSPRQSVEIRIGPPRATRFSAEELRQFFR